MPAVTCVMHAIVTAVCRSGHAAAGSNYRRPASGVRCLSYAVSLSSAERDAGKIAISPTLWMWRPRLAHDDEILATFFLPDANRVFVPWRMRDNSGTRYSLVATPESGTATAVFGQFEQQLVQVAGAELRVVLLGQRDDIELEYFLDWIRTTAGNIEIPYGRFPDSHASVLLIPVSSGPRSDGRPVVFGRVVRDGGATVELMINPDLPVADYYKA